MNELFKPMKVLIGGLLEPPIPPTEESLMWNNVLRIIIEHSTEGKTMEEALETLEKIYEIKLK